MPQFTYRCSRNHEFAKIRKIEERDEPLKCPEKDCDGEVERTIALTGPPKFNGPGFTRKFYR